MLNPFVDFLVYDNMIVVSICFDLIVILSYSILKGRILIYKRFLNTEFCFCLFIHFFRITELVHVLIYFKLDLKLLASVEPHMCILFVLLQTLLMVRAAPKPVVDQLTD